MTSTTNTEAAASKPTSNTCIVLPGAPSWSETFLQAHVEKLGGKVRYKGQFPIDVEATFKEIPSGTSAKLKRAVRASLHRYLVNSVKRRDLRKFFRLNKIDMVLAEYGDTGVAVLYACKEMNIPLVVHFHGADAYLR